MSSGKRIGFANQCRFAAKTSGAVSGWIFALLLTASTNPAFAAPFQQTECVTDALNAPQFKAIMKAFFAEKIDQAEQSIRARKAIAPTVKRCAAKYGWSELDIENAYNHTEIHTAERVMYFVMEMNKIDPVAVNRVYKEEPLSRVEMIIALDDKKYVASLVDRMSAAGLPMKRKDVAPIVIAYIAFRLLADQSFFDFENGRKFGEEIDEYQKMLDSGTDPPAATDQETEAPVDAPAPAL